MYKTSITICVEGLHFVSVNGAFGNEGQNIKQKRAEIPPSSVLYQCRLDCLFGASLTLDDLGIKNGFQRDVAFWLYRIIANNPNGVVGVAFFQYCFKEYFNSH